MPLVLFADLQLAQLTRQSQLPAQIAESYGASFDLY